MNYNDIITLARAGFSAQQIAALQQLAPAAPAPVPATPAPAAPAPAAPAPAAPAPAAPAPASPAPAAPAPAADPNGAKLDTLIALIQQQQLGAPQPRTMTADEILADIIAPQPPKTDDK